MNNMLRERIRFLYHEDAMDIKDLFNIGDMCFQAGIQFRDKEMEQLRGKLSETLIKVLENEYSHTFDDDYIIPIDSGLNEELIIKTLQEIIGKPWTEIKD